jgi:TolA-binding protein
MNKYTKLPTITVLTFLIAFVSVNVNATDDAGTYSLQQILGIQADAEYANVDLTTTAEGSIIKTTVEDPSKIGGCQKGDRVELINLGNGEWKVKHLRTGKGFKFTVHKEDGKVKITKSADSKKRFNSQKSDDPTKLDRAIVQSQTIYCYKCGEKTSIDNTFCTKCGTKLKKEMEQSPYDQANELYQQGEYDQVIRLLEDHCASKPSDKKSQLLLAKAYLEKCELMKQKGNKGYKYLVWKPFEIGQRIHLLRDEHLSEALYVCAKSFYINDRSLRANKYVKKAIKLSYSPPLEYYFLLGDSQAHTAKEQKFRGNTYRSYYKSHCLSAKNTYEMIIKMGIPNDKKALAYYKLGLSHLNCNNERDAKKAFSSALQLAEKDSLVDKINKELKSK